MKKYRRRRTLRILKGLNRLLKAREVIIRDYEFILSF